MKVRKVFGTETTDYLDGFQYTNSVLKFFPTAGGYFNYETGKYVYNYTDHLGNTRLSYAKNGAGTEIIEESNYYPFGLKHEGYNVFTGNLAYKYKYNGKELQETGMYDYGARMYMPDLGRWGVLDPASDYLPEYSPYVFTFNDPIGFVDNDGEFPGPAGAIIGLLADYAGQVGYNYFFGESNYNLRHAMTNNINGWSMAISGATGFATGGIDSLKNVVTSGVGKPIFQKLINNGIDILVNTIGNTAADYLNTEDGKEYDFWKSLTGGLLSASLEKVIPIKYIDKLEQKLFRKMNISANKVARIKDKLTNLRRNKTIRKWTNKLQDAEKDLNKYNEAWAGVKIVNDSYKKFGANSLTNELFLKEDSKTKKAGKLFIGELTEEKKTNEK
ncbi:RHS repeat-associated protein [Chryseobacterium sp. PvR013]|nr:RHS repeat-associated protein [Chryseobacterium sp. PvR013]